MISSPLGVKAEAEGKVEAAEVVVDVEGVVAVLVAEEIVDPEVVAVVEETEPPEVDH